MPNTANSGQQFDLPDNMWFENQTANNWDSRIGNGALPIGIQGSQNRAFTRTVQGDELAQTRLEGLENQDSAYMNNARRNGLGVAGARGLLNSSMAAGASQKAALDAAMPIALADAQAFRAAAGENLSALNQQAIVDKQLASSRSNAASGMAQQRKIAQMNIDAALQRQREDLAFQGEQKGLDRNFTQARDYWLNEYAKDHDISVQNNASRNGRRDYMYKTGVDIYAQNALWPNKILDATLANPDEFTPEAVGGLVSTFGPMWDNISKGTFDDIFANFDW